MHDFRLQANSPVVDAGVNNAPSIQPTDLDGNPRIMNGTVDMGAYELFGSTVFGDITVNPTPLNFGGVAIGSTSTPQTITITNTGNADLIIGRINLTGTHAGEFTLQDDTCSVRTMAPAGICTTEVVFMPMSTGDKTVTINVPSSDPETHIVTVVVTGFAQ